MMLGIRMNRELVCVLTNGLIVLDWSDGRAIDLINREFVAFRANDYGHAVQDAELDMLKRMGSLTGYDQHYVYITSLPDSTDR